MSNDTQKEFVIEMEKYVGSDLRQCRNCFMTGKPCINQREISQKVGKMERSDPSGKFPAKSFVLMPFRPLMTQVYQTQLKPCLESIFESVNRADDITMTGYIICEKICKEIQSARLICAELSSNNHNVFYELGLAFALRRDTCLLVQQDCLKSRANVLQKLNILENEITTYSPFEMLRKEHLCLKRNTYKPSSQKRYNTILLAEMSSFQENIDDTTFVYRVDSICKSAVHRCLDKIDTNSNTSILKGLERKSIRIEEAQYVDVDKKTNLTFENVQDCIENSECVFVCTSESEPCSYFWLGYAHGLDKVVVPISVHADQQKPLPSLDADMRRIETLQAAGSSQPSDSIKEKFLPFDVRALWHIYFSKEKIDELEKQVDSILDIIAFKDKERSNRKGFWNRFLEPGQVSIFVGAVELTINNRHVVGEWDYRTVAELTNFVTSIKETTETIIQTPTIQISQELLKKKQEEQEDNLTEYTKDLINRIRDKNAIVIASADVNDMTEVALSEMTGISAFSPNRRRVRQFNGLVAFKKRTSDPSEWTPHYTFYEVVDPKQGEGKLRGFYDYTGGTVNKEEGVYETVHEIFSEASSIISDFFAHICKYYNREIDRQVVVLQGITGPATLGVAQALTGAKNKQFTIYENKQQITDFSEREREAIDKLRSRSSSFDAFFAEGDLGTLLDRKAEEITFSLESVFMEHSSVEALLRIYMMNDPKITHHDERKILWWDFEIEPRPVAKAKKV